MKETLMTSASPKAKLINVKINEGKTGLFFATSPDLKGLLVAEADIETLYKSIPKAIEAMYEACGVDVAVTMIEDNLDAPDMHHWVAFPRSEMQNQADCH